MKTINILTKFKWTETQIFNAIQTKFISTIITLLSFQYSIKEKAAKSRIFTFIVKGPTKSEREEKHCWCH